jgi:hypothetical protein
LFTQRRKRAKELTPAAFEALVEEILELAGMTEKIHAQETTMSIKVTQLHQELIQLQNLLKKKEFKRLSESKRIELKKNLMFSKNQLLETMRSAPPPTNIIQ